MSLGTVVPLITTALGFLGNKSQKEPKAPEYIAPPPPPPAPAPERGTTDPDEAALQESEKRRDLQRRQTLYTPSILRSNNSNKKNLLGE